MLVLDTYILNLHQVIMIAEFCFLSSIIEQKKVPMAENVHNRAPNEMADLKENSLNSR